jgi:hypothetical protein
MDELVSNLIYFVPIAFIVAIRIFSARQKQAQKEEQKKTTGELVGKIQEARNWPDTSKKPPAKKQVKAPVKAQSPAGKYRPAFSAASPARTPARTPAEQRPVTAVSSVADSGKKPAGNVPPESARPGVWPEKIARLPPLQQALVWSELLGTPRSEQEI